MMLTAKLKSARHVLQKWIQSYETALWKIERFLEWQGRARIQISVPWEVGHKWRVGTHIKLALLHVLGGASRLCVCESVKKNNQSGKVTANLIYLEPTSLAPSTFNIINESGIRDTVVDESAFRTIDISESEAI